jgi:hypothetical protein
MPNVHTICPSAQAVARGTSVDRVTAFQETSFSYSRVLETCMSINIYGSVSLTITVLSHIRYIFVYLGAENV